MVGPQGAACRRASPYLAPIRRLTRPKIETRTLIRHALLLLVLVSACRTETAPPGRPVQDDLGRTVAVPARITRIVSLAPSVTELIYAAGAGSKLVAVTDADDYPPEVAGLERIQALPVNREAVVVLRPQLVLASEQVNDPRDADALATLGIPTWFVVVDSLGDVTRAIRDLGALLGTEPAANRTADSLDALHAALLATPEPPSRPGVLLLVGDRSLFSFGGQSYAHDLVRLAGGRSVTADLTTKAPVLSDEFVLDAAPDVIVGAFGTEYDPGRLLGLHPTWTSVPAVRNHAVHSIDPDLILRPGPRLFSGVLAIREALRASTPSR